jgi:Pvc16 N-terminal domain/Carboxypeptidase regulatory-like domain
MARTVSVPLNTMLADLDETLRTLLERELARHGFDGVEISFDAPASEWSASISSPTVNLFLYDLREAVDYRPIEWEPRDRNGGTVDVRPPLRIDASFSVTAWTRAVEDEHRLLSQVLAILYAYPTLPEDALTGALADPASQRYPLHTRVAQTRTDGKADFWSAVGGQYKASVDYVVTVSCEAGTVLERGPEVGTQTIRLRRSDGGSSVEELHRIEGVVRDAQGEPVANAWVILAETAWCSSGSDGRFHFDGLAPGTYRCQVRAPDGRESETKVAVPGRKIDLQVNGGKRARSPSR